MGSSEKMTDTLIETDVFMPLKLDCNESPNILASAADFDIEELFKEQCGSSPSPPTDAPLPLTAVIGVKTRDEFCAPKEVPNPEFILHLPPLHSIKRPKLYTPPEPEMPALKRPKTYTKVISNNKSGSNIFKKSVPDLLLPENVVPGPIDELLGSTVLPAEASQALLAIKAMKEKMISTHTLLTTYTALRRTSTQANSQLALTRTQLVDAARWRTLLADENARLKARVAIVGKEEEHLKCAVRKLTKDTNGLHKNEALRHEIVEKNREIERLLRKCEEL